MMQPSQIGELLLYRMSVITRSTSLPMVRLFEGEFGITRRHWHILALLTENGAMSAADIAAHSWLDRPQISRGLGGLRNLGLVERIPGVARAMNYRATPAGHAFYRKAFAQVALFNVRLASLLSASQRSALDKILQILQKQVITLARDAADHLQPAPRSLGGRRPRYSAGATAGRGTRAAGSTAATRR